MSTRVRTHDEVLGYLLKHAHLALEERTDAALAPLGVTSRDLGVLRVVAGGEARSQQEVAVLLGIDRTTMVAFLDALERAGSIARRPDEHDRRRNVIGYLADRLAKLGVEDELFRAGAVAGSTVVIGGDGGMVFDWEPTLTSTAELITSARGTDARIGATSRPTRNERREEYFERMDAKAEARAELERERQAGLWADEDED